jgi:hypothetical protein
MTPTRGGEEIAARRHVDDGMFAGITVPAGP